MVTPQRISWAFHVPGTPAPKGSKTYLGNGRMRESSVKVGPWQDAICAEIWQQTAGSASHTMTTPVGVDVDFYLPRPKQLPKKATVHGRRPDLDKLLRSTLDGLTRSKLIADDNLVTYIRAGKHYVSDVHPVPGASIRVFEIFDVVGGLE